METTAIANVVGKWINASRKAFFDKARRVLAKAAITGKIYIAKIMSSIMEE